jgi:HEAT repeat protein
MLEAEEAGPSFAAAVLDTRASLRVAAAEAIAEMGIAAAAPELRESLERYPDVSTSAVAYALGVVGTHADLPRILNALDACQTSLTRRQGLLGVARLLDVEREVYRLMLLEGMAKDSALMELLKAAGRRSKQIQIALHHYSESREPEALQILASAVHAPGLAELAEHPVPEAFLVASAVAAKTVAGK